MFVLGMSGQRWFPYLYLLNRSCEEKKGWEKMYWSPSTSYTPLPAYYQSFQHRKQSNWAIPPLSHLAAPDIPRRPRCDAQPTRQLLRLRISIFDGVSDTDIRPCDQNLPGAAATYWDYSGEIFESQGYSSAPKR